MKVTVCSARVCALIVFLTANISSLNAQMPLAAQRAARGQDVSPTFEGWELNADGTFSLYFGYYNRNTEEEIDVPLGSGNTFDLGDGDQGQPSHFYPGRHWFVFKAIVPKDWPQSKRLIWTLTTKGRTSQSKGWLQPEWEIDKALITKNSAPDPFLRIQNASPNPDSVAPAIEGSNSQTISLPATAKLRATATADRVHPAVHGGRMQALRIQWILYRGPGKVEFDPKFTPLVNEGSVTSETTVTFSAPGSYRLRAIATDGSRFSTFDADVTVNPGSSAQSAP